MPPSHAFLPSTPLPTSITLHPCLLQPRRSSPIATAIRLTPASIPSSSTPLPTPLPSPPPIPSLPQNATPYFAYFANMNPRKIGPLATLPLRRFPLLHSAIATLADYRIVFDVPAFPPEPVFANIQPAQGTSIHGIVHWMKHTDFETLALSEGIFSAFGRVEEVEVLLADGTEVIAKTFVYAKRIPDVVTALLKPSRRYVQLAVDGAEHWGIDDGYVDRVLKSVKYETGILGAFGLYVEPRPHILDRPNPQLQFGRVESEIYSPWKGVGAKEAVEKLEEVEERMGGDRLSLINVSKRGGRRKLYYVPGIDGNGKGILSQMEGFDEDGEYDVSALIYPYGSRQSVGELANELIELLLDDAQEGAVSVVGESMGGMLTICMALENVKRKTEGERSLELDLILLINPATCYARSTPRELWDFLLTLGISNAVYSALLPPLLLPFIMDWDSVRHDLGPEMVPRLRKMLFSLAKVADVLPQDALLHRLELLSKVNITGAELAVLSGPYGPTDVAVISSSNDKLIPSLSENYRMQRHIPNMYSSILPFGGHLPTFDKRFSLINFMKPFKQLKKKVEPVAVKQKDVDPKRERRRAAMVRRYATRSSVRKLGPKSRAETRKIFEFLAEWNIKSSPIFIGEENLPDPVDGKPVLFVCNHTLLGWTDAMYPSLQILRTKKVMLRPLAHPKLSTFENLALPGTPSVTRNDMKDFGIVEVNPSNMMELFAKGEWSLLFPGGAREALKSNSSKKYSVLWPESPEFIRACALFGVTVIPLSAVGSEDMVKLVVDTEAGTNVLKRLDDALGPAVDLRSLFFDNARDWQGSAADPNDEFWMVPPLMTSTGPDRLYYRFGKPIEIPEECVDDPVMEKKVYGQLRQSLTDGIEILLQRREADAFRSIEKRTEFANAHGKNVEPPASPAWAWSRGRASYLGEDLQPPI